MAAAALCCSSLLPAMEPTERFQQALPFLLLPVSEPLAALHASRGTISPPNPDLCSSCGIWLHSGSARSRLARSKSQKARALQTSCLACGHVRTMRLAGYSPEQTRDVVRIPPIEPDARADIVNLPSNSMALPATRKDKPRDIVASPINNKFVDGAVGSISSLRAPQSRPKKKSGLQAMLARNREQEQARAKGKDHTGVSGLSAFLNGL